MPSTSPLLAAFDRQIGWCREPAPFTARLLQHGRDWLAGDGEAHAVFAGLSDDPLAAALALRWASALHHLALRGLQPWSACWPSTADDPGAPVSDAALAEAVQCAWQDQRAQVLRALARPPQTNEVQRSAVLLPGLLHVAAVSGGLPLGLLEIGASAGLNLWCDRYRHDHGGWTWGDPAAALTLRADWSGPPPPATALQVQHRAACDAAPLCLADPDEGLRLASFVWPEQHERRQRLRRAIAASQPWSAAEGVTVEALPAARFVARELAAARPGRATVLMHSVVWQYIASDEQQAIAAALARAAERASVAAPLAWLRFEPPQPDAATELRCTLWPGGVDRLLARAHPHGARIEWCADGAAA